METAFIAVAGVAILIQAVILYRLADQLDRMEEVLAEITDNTFETRERVRTVQRKMTEGQAPVPWGRHV